MVMLVLGVSKKPTTTMLTNQGELWVLGVSKTPSTTCCHR